VTWDPEETLFVISSKTFVTLETMTNAHTARSGRWPSWDPRTRSQALRSPSRPTPRGLRVRHHTDNMFGFWTGSAGATRWIPRSVSRRCSPSGRRLQRHARRFHAVDEHFKDNPIGETCPDTRPALASGTATSRGTDRRRLPMTSTAPLPGLPPAAHDGVEREARHLDGPTSTTRRARSSGRARDERPALLLPADPPGTRLIPARLSSLHAHARRPPIGVTPITTVPHRCDDGLSRLAA